MTVLLTDNLPLLAGAPNAIKKLRELILELAVRGKLVPPDPSDEPASELLKRIAEEKARLVAEGKIKKPKPLSHIDENEAPFHLPKSWQWARLGDLSELITSGSRDWAQHYSNDGAIFVRMGNLSRRSYALRLSSIQRVSPPKHGEGSRTKLEPGDFLISITGEVGLLGLIPEKFGEAYINQHVCLIRFISSLRGRFIPEALRSPLAYEQYEAPQRGIKNSFRLSDVSEILLPLPPLVQQHRIVAKVDELMALCDRLEAQQADAESAHARLVQALLDSLTQTTDATDFASNWQRLAENFHTLFTTEPSIDALKQTLLQLAVMGKLVPQDPSNEPASVLLKRIAEEKARLVAEGKIKKQKQSAQISDEEKLFELPKGWCWTRLGAIGVSTTGKTPNTNNPAFFGGDIPFIGPGQISLSGKIVDPEKWLTELAREETSVVKSGDILMVCIGGSIGKCAIADRKVAFNQQINSLRTLFVDARYAFCTMTTPAFRAAVWASATGTATPIINRSKWDELLISIPPLGEQQRIVAKVDQLMALCEQLKVRLIKASQLNEQLISHLVKQAVA